MKNGDDTVTYHFPIERIKDTHTKKVGVIYNKKKVGVIYNAGQRAVR